MGAWVRGGGGRVGGWGQGRWEQRSEACVKIQKKKWGGVGSGGSDWGVRVDVNGEVKLLGKFKKKIFFLGGGGGRVGGGGEGGRGGAGSGRGGGGASGWGVRVDVIGEVKFL